MTAKDKTQIALTVFIMALLGYATLCEYSAAIEQVLIALAMLASGYWLGSSKGSADKTEHLGRMGRRA
jgi:hypothetical protein